MGATATETWECRALNDWGGLVHQNYRGQWMLADAASTYAGSSTMARALGGRKTSGGGVCRRSIVQKLALHHLIIETAEHCTLIATVINNLLRASKAATTNAQHPSSDKYPVKDQASRRNAGHHDLSRCNHSPSVEPMFKPLPTPDPAAQMANPCHFLPDIRHTTKDNRGTRPGKTNRLDRPTAAHDNSCCNAALPY